MTSPLDACAEPHQGCGCERDASQGAHTGPCEYEGGYGEWPYDEVRCVLCLAAIREQKRTACPDCGGQGTVAVHVCEDERECRRRCLQVQACMSCVGTGRRAS
jgi:hypothetical protein